jgi:hypothetical protein
MSKGKQKFSEKTLTDVESFIEALGKSYSSGSVSLHLDLLSTLALKAETATRRLILEWEAESKEYFEKTHILPFTHSAYRGDALQTQELADRLGLAEKCTLKPNERNNSNPSHLALFRIITEFNIVRCSRPMGEHKSRFIPELGGRESEVLKKVNALSDLSVDTKDEWLSAIVDCLMLYPTMKDSQLNEYLSFHCAYKALIEACQSDREAKFKGKLLGRMNTFLDKYPNDTRPDGEIDATWYEHERKELENFDATEECCRYGLRKHVKHLLDKWVQ